MTRSPWPSTRSCVLPLVLAYAATMGFAQPSSVERELDTRRLHGAAYYENGDFWTPTTYREFLFPIVKADAELAHQKGSRLGYIITSSCMPLLKLFAEAGIDALIGLDPEAWDMADAKKKLGDKVCLWGGVNGHLTVEQGSSEDVRAEVRQAMEILAPNGGFILSPVDNVRENTPRARENVSALIDEWQQLTGQ